jgi:hypothetical protein
MQFTAKKARLMGAGLAGLLVLLVCGVLLYAWPGRRGSGDDACSVYRGLNNSVLRFVSPEEGRAALAADDEWIGVTSELQRAALMGIAPPATREAFRTWQGDNVRAWSEPERARWCRALETMAPAINALNLPLPREILLVNTTGRESADTPHTRGNAIAIPTASFDAQGFSDVEVLSHELFHVVSRHAPALATRLYALIGFESASELEWPASWLPLRIADADAPHHRHLMRVAHEGEEIAVMPLVIASHSPLRRGEVITAVMEVRLLEVMPGSGSTPTRALLRDGEPLWHEPDELSDFAAKLGDNTDYTIHPEEAMADNFMFLVSGRPVANPALLQRIAALLKQAP